MRRLIREAVEENSLQQLKTLLDFDFARDRSLYEEYLGAALHACVAAGNVDLTAHVLSYNPCLSGLRPCIIIGPHVSLLLVDTLLAHGWDVNTQDRRGPDTRRRRLIDYACGDPVLLCGLVERGAMVDGGEDEYEIMPQPAMLLETCAAEGSVATWKYLRARGARLGRRTLHRAAGAAAVWSSDPEAEDGGPGGEHGTPGGGSSEDIAARRRHETAEMLRFLVDDLKLDINAMDTDVPMHAWHWGTPICYAAAVKGGAAVVRWLLARGADPRIRNMEGHRNAVEVARALGCDENAGVFRDWESTGERHGEDGFTAESSSM